MKRNKNRNRNRKRILFCAHKVKYISSIYIFNTYPGYYTSVMKKYTRRKGRKGPRGPRHKKDSRRRLRYGGVSKRPSAIPSARQSSRRSAPLPPMIKPTRQIYNYFAYTNIYKYLYIFIYIY